MAAYITLHDSNSVTTITRTTFCGHDGVTLWALRIAVELNVSGGQVSGRVLNSTVYKSSAVAEMGDRRHNRHGPKRGGGCCAPFAERWEPV